MRPPRSLPSPPALPPSAESACDTGRLGHRHMPPPNGCAARGRAGSRRRAPRDSRAVQPRPARLFRAVRQVHGARAISSHPATPSARLRAAAQCEDGSYDLEVYLAILKLYQLYPERFDLDTACTLLLKSITALPRNDVLLCLYCLSEEQQETAQVRTLVDLHQSLQSCVFDDVWEFLSLDMGKETLQTRMMVDTSGGSGEPKRELVPVPVVGFVESIREFAAHIISGTYQVVDLSIISGMLGGLAGAELAAFAEKRGWKIEGDKAQVGKHDDSVVSKKIVEGVSFDQLIPIMSAR